MRALVIDDESLARKRIINLLHRVPEIEVLGECADGKTAVQLINRQKPDLIFLDLNLKDMNGFEVLQKIEVSPKPIVILVTAHDSYASTAFDVDVFDFLLKPFRDERFFKTINKVLLSSPPRSDTDFERKIKDIFEIYSDKTHSRNLCFKIPVKQGNKTVLVDPNEIFYIVASGYYAEIYTAHKKYVIRESLNNLDEVLDPTTFLRIHRSAILNVNHVEEIVHSEHAEIDAKMADGKLLHISKSNKKQFLEKLGI